MVNESSASCNSSASRIGRPGFGRDLRDGGGVERAGAVGVIGRQGAAHLHGAGAALFERRVVEIGVRIGVEDLVRERRRLGRVDGDGLRSRLGDVAEQRA